MEETILPITLTRNGRLCIIIASERGGVRKTTTAILVGLYLRDLGFDVRLIQVDQQSQLGAMFPGRVQPIEVASGDEMRGDDLIDARRFAPLTDSMSEDQPGVVTIIDVGANVDRRICDYLRAQGADDICRASTTNVLALTPFTSDDDARKLAARTARRIAQTFLSVPIVPVFCEDGVGGRRSDEDVIAQIESVGCEPWNRVATFLRHPRLHPGALHLLQKSGLDPFAFADPSNLARIANAVNDGASVIRQARADVTIYVANAVRELDKVVRLA